MKAKFVHPSITEAVIVEAVERRMLSLDNPGFCTKCGEESFECEPDAIAYRCEECDTRTVYGAEELLMRGWYHKA